MLAFFEGDLFLEEWENAAAQVVEAFEKGFELFCYAEFLRFSAVAGSKEGHRGQYARNACARFPNFTITERLLQKFYRKFGFQFFLRNEFLHLIGEFLAHIHSPFVVDVASCRCISYKLHNQVFLVAKVGGGGY